MTTRLRLTSFWLLALALSLQGVSAAAAHCVAGSGAADAHAGMSTSGPMSMVVAMHASAGPDGMSADVPASKATDHQTTPHSSVAKCGACSPCCIAAAPPAGRLDVVPVDATHAIGSTVAIVTPTFLTDGQDRPPRSALA